jgi:hypothetical protein
VPPAPELFGVAAIPAAPEGAPSSALQPSAQHTAASEAVQRPLI